MTAGYAPFIRWKFDASGLEPGLAESWEFNEDGSMLTLHLRKGGQMVGWASLYFRLVRFLLPTLP